MTIVDNLLSQQLSAEYLKRACINLRRAFEAGQRTYMHEYRRKIQGLAERLLALEEATH